MKEETKKPLTKHTIFLVIIGIMVLILVIGASFGYFVSTQSGEGEIPVDVTTKTVDSLILSASRLENGVEVDGSSNITIEADQDNFGQSNTDLKK